MVPTKTHIKFGSRMSTRGERCAYFEGSAYLLDVRCFLLGRGEGADAVFVVATVTVVRERFVVVRGETGDGISFSLAEPLVYWYFDS